MAATMAINSAVAMIQKLHTNGNNNITDLSFFYVAEVHLEKD
jgi:hypothetical protein